MGDDRAYIRLGELEMRIPLDSRTQIGFDGELLFACCVILYVLIVVTGEVLTTRFRAKPIKLNESTSGDQAVRTVKRTASVFTGTPPS